MMALIAREIIKILEDPIDENVRICDSGSELESVDDVLSDDFQSDNHLIRSGNEEELPSQDEDVSALNGVGQRVKHARIASDWEWIKVGDYNYFAQKIPFSGNPGAQHQTQSPTHSFKLFFTMS